MQQRIQKVKPRGLSVISPILFQNMKSIYFLSLKLGLSHNEYREKFNIYTRQSIAVIPIAIATWEAFLNEVLFVLYSNNKISEQRRKEILKLKLRKKTKDIPKLFGGAFDTSTAPFQDYCYLEELRHSIVHFDFDLRELKHHILDYLERKKLTLPTFGKSGFVYPDEICSSEMVRWSINTIADMMIKFTSFCPNDHGIINISSRSRIEETQIRELFRIMKMDMTISQENYHIGSERAELY
ncbi:MAG: hypothetical protein IPG01_03590 [Chitinophagaceae bacterium]|nr:hypothetical protein [Chitinophagaceae bacterium]